MFVIFCLTYITQHNALKVPLCCCKWQDFQLFMAEQFSIVYIHRSSLSVHLSVDLLGHFRILAIVNSAAVNAGVCPGSSQVERAHFLWVNTRSGVAGSQGSCDSHFLRRLRSVFCSSRTVCICTSSAQVPFSLHSHQLLSVVLLITAILTGVSWYLTVVLLCIFLMINGVEHLFI